MKKVDTKTQISIQLNREFSKVKALSKHVNTLITFRTKYHQPILPNKSSSTRIDWRMAGNTTGQLHQKLSYKCFILSIITLPILIYN